MHSIPLSTALYQRAERLIPGGVNSPVRAFKHVGGTPIYIKRAEGAFLYDEDGYRYLDFCLAFGPLILGHSPKEVLTAIAEQAPLGLAYGACHAQEVEFAERLLRAFPYAEQARLVVSGTEAVMTAIRLARAATHRRLVVKFSGCYHGHGDALLVKAGSGLATQGLPESAGVSVQTAKETYVLTLGDEDSFNLFFKDYGQDVACVIIEPMPANNGLLLQTNAFLKNIKSQCEKYGALLIFDEVISGFRNHFGGYGKTCGVEPDITTLAKIIGGGMPIGAVLGKRSVMSLLAPMGPVYQAGTMSAHALSVACGIATLKVLEQGDVYLKLADLSAYLGQLFRASSLPSQGVQLIQSGSVFWLYWHLGSPPKTAEQIAPQAMTAYRERYSSWLKSSIYLPPSAYEVGFLSAAHERTHMEQLIIALERSVGAC